MVINKCALLLIVLILASIVMQFIRARKRQKLVRHADWSSLPAHCQEKRDSVDRSFDPLFKDFRKLQIIKENMELQPGHIREEFNNYRFFSRIEILITTSMLLFCGIAFYLCD